MLADTIPPAQPTDSIELGHSFGWEPNIIAETSITTGVLEQQQHEEAEAGTQSLIETPYDDQ